MSKFIRTNEGIYELKENMTIETGIFSFFGKIYNTSEKHLFRNDKDFGEFVSQGDTIEELFMPNDLLVVGDDKNQMPIFIESIEYLKAWLYCHDIYKIKEFYIKNGNDFKCVAKQSEKGDLELI